MSLGVPPLVLQPAERASMTSRRSPPPKLYIPTPKASSTVGGGESLVARQHPHYLDVSEGCMCAGWRSVLYAVLPVDIPNNIEETGCYVGCLKR